MPMPAQIGNVYSKISITLTEFWQKVKKLA